MVRAKFVNYINLNPFKPSEAGRSPGTTIRFDVRQNDSATFGIYNIKGQEVKSFSNFSEGSHEVVWNGEDKNGKKVSSGVYFYQLKSESVNEIKKMILVK